SYVYSVMWPFFAMYVGYLWYRIAGVRPAAGPAPAAAQREDLGGDEEVLRYNHYLARKRAAVQQRRR
ncbi:MAG: hypothetical protein ACRDRL_25255, partial [Sciscionella sp.]